MPFVKGTTILSHLYVFIVKSKGIHFADKLRFVFSHNNTPLDLFYVLYSLILSG